MEIPENTFPPKLLMDFAGHSRLGVAMENAEDIVLSLLSVTAGLLEEAATLAPLSDRTSLPERIRTLDCRVTDAGRIIAAAQWIHEHICEMK